MKTESISPAILSPEVKQDAKLKKACQDFEAVLIQQMLTSMRQTVEKSNLFGDREKEDIFQSMLDQETSIQLSKKGSLQIAELLYKQLSTIHKSTDTTRTAQNALDIMTR